MRRIVKVWENKTAYQTPSYPTQLKEIHGYEIRGNLMYKKLNFSIYYEIIQL